MALPRDLPLVSTKRKSRNMKACMIAAPASGSGKTTITMGLLRALKDRGLDVCSYKTGPDYIDRAYLEAASGKPAGNLDLHLQREEGLIYALAQAQSDYCVIEGVMGYFDGIYNTYQGSSYHIARLLDIPTVLIYTPGAEMFSIIPKLKGMAQFEKAKTLMDLKNPLADFSTVKAHKCKQDFDGFCRTAEAWELNKIIEDFDNWASVFK